MVVASMDTGLTTMLLVAGGLLSVAAVLKDERVLFMLPTVISLLAIGQFMRASSANALGTYCQIIEHKIREACGSDRVVMSWEGSTLWRVTAHPAGIVTGGFLFIAAVGLTIFATVAYRAYFWWRPSAAIHGTEMLLVVVYAAASARLNLPSRRANVLDSSLETRLTTR